MLPLGPMSNWKHSEWAATLRPLIGAAVLAVVGALVITALLGSWNLRAVAGWIGGLWLMAGAVAYVMRQRRQTHGRMTRGQWGMSLAHFGVGVFVIGVAMVESTTFEKDLRMEPGQEVQAAGYTFRLNEVVTVKGPNWAADEARLTVVRNGEERHVMTPQKRRYYRSGQVMSQIELQPGFTRDLYVALGEPIGGGAWSMRIHIKPFIRWIWGGAVLMLAGGLIAATDRRYWVRRTRHADQSEPTSSAATGNREALAT